MARAGSQVFDAVTGLVETLESVSWPASISNRNGVKVKFGSAPAGDGLAESVTVDGGVDDDVQDWEAMTRRSDRFTVLVTIDVAVPAAAAVTWARLKELTHAVEASLRSTDGSPVALATQVSTESDNVGTVQVVVGRVRPRLVPTEAGHTGFCEITVAFMAMH